MVEEFLILWLDQKIYKENRDRAINLINQVNWVNGFFRSDIGHKVIDE